MPAAAEEPEEPPLLTGERTWPGIPRENYWFMRHLACYRWAAATIAGCLAGPRVDGPLLDAGAGEGYGSAELAQRVGREVVALELDERTAGHTRTHYPSLAVTRANLVALPCRDDAFAASVSLQVIEHIWDPQTYLRELDRCTAGHVVVSTPNRPVHSPHIGRGQRPDNPFHVREFDALELRDLLAQTAPDRTPRLYGLLHGPRIVEWESARGSLPTALLNENEHENDDSRTTHTFASSITDTDFVIEEMDPRNMHDSALDLVALW